jgi:predicted nuclease of predicted toxin-antitoxin system
MRFKVDENLPIEVKELLQQANHDALTILEQQLGGHTDFNIASICQQERRALITLDVDFADIRAYPPDQFPGLVVLRLRRQDKLHVLEILTQLMHVFLDEPLDRHLWIVEEERIRVRG